MKIGDLVRLKGKGILPYYDGKPGIILGITEPTPLSPYQIVTVMWEPGTELEISARQLELINECR